MSRPALYLNVPHPCHEDWQTMTPTGVGRHCAACDKVVTDFSRMTDGELVKWFQRHRGERVCGRFTTLQIGRPLLVALEPAPVWRRWALAALAVVGVGNSAVAQTGEVTHRRSGAIQVVNSQTGVPIIGARVLIHEGNRLRSILTDSTGCVWKSTPHWWKVDVFHPYYYQTEGWSVGPYQPAFAGGVIERIALTPFEVEVEATVELITEVVGVVITQPPVKETAVPASLSEPLQSKPKRAVEKIFRRHRGKASE